MRISSSRESAIIAPERVTFGWPFHLRRAIDFAYAPVDPLIFQVGHSAQLASPSEQFSSPATRRHSWWQTAVLVVLIGWLYSSILYHLVGQWWQDPNFSHGFFVPLFSAFVLWQDRFPLAALPATPSSWGLFIVVGALFVLILGVMGAELFLSRVSLLLLIAGLIIFFLGWNYFRAVLFPWAFLILMIPIPAIVFNQITFPLQLLASKIAAVSLPLLGVPVLREGNVINLPAMALEVAEACSGIRSLFSLITLSVIYGYLAETRIGIRILLALMAIPVSILANALRIAVTGLVVQHWGIEGAQGTRHLLSGWLVFAGSLLLIFVLHRLSRIFLAGKQTSLVAEEYA